MREVAVAGAHALEPDNYWSKGLSDLLSEAAAPLVSGIAIDGIFCAGGAFLQRQGDPAAIVADRLSLSPDIALSLEAGDVSGAAALYTAWQHVQSGACRHALVLGAAKVSDVSEAARLSLMDASLDPDADIARGIDFTAQAGLLAGHYCRSRGKDAAVFAEATAENLAAWAKYKGRHIPTAQELRHDLLVAPPLVRSDFAQLLDGACALVLSDAGACETPRAILGAMTSATDVVSVWERKDPLAFEAVRNAVRRLPSNDGTWLEIDAAVSIAHILSREAVAAVLENSHGWACNRRGGAQGRGRVMGSSALYQLADICEIAGRGESALLVAVSGLGSHIFAARLTGIT